MADKDSPAPLDQLGARIREARKVVRPAGSPVTSQRQMGLAYRVLVEMIAGIGVGAFLGWVLDNWLGTLPLFIAVLVVLGFAAGMLNAYRAIRQADEGRENDESGSGPSGPAGEG